MATSYKVLVFERRSADYTLDDQIVLLKDKQIIAEMVDQGTFEDAHTIVNTLNDAQSNGSRPSKAQAQILGVRFNEAQDRNREHIRKTMELNMAISREKHGLIQYYIKHELGQAIRWAAELYSIRSFVTGIIEGRGYQLNDTELQALKRSWEDGWDQAFGDLVGQVLKMQ